MPYTYELWTPQLIFSAHNDEVELLEAKLRTSELIVKFTAVPRWILGTVGVPPLFLNGMNQLICFVTDVDATKDALIQTKIDKATDNNAMSVFEAEVKVIRNRLSRMVQDIPRSDRTLEVVPALTSCEKTLALFEDKNYAFWQKPEVSSPLLVSFAGLYVVIAKMAVELMETYKNDIAKEMKHLGDVVDDYRKRFLCFRLYQVKYPVISFKVVIDDYDKKFRKTRRRKWNGKVECYYMVKQEYTSLLGKTYGSFFDSAKLAIVQSGLLAPDITLSTNWCTEHPRCCSLFRNHKGCICSLKESDLILDHWYANCKDAVVERMITAGKCLAGIASVRHYGYSCITCDTDKYNGLICISCIRKCHEGHEVKVSCCDWFFCLCRSNSLSMNCKLQILEEVPKFDVSKKNRDSAVVTREAEADNNWSYVYCHECEENPLAGPRYKCTECNDYDLCHDCLQYGIHAEHTFVRMINSPDGSENTDVVHRQVGCDGCDSVPLCGKRYKCVTCEDYNLCTGCLANKIHSYHEFEEVELKSISTKSWNKLIAAMKKARLQKLDSVLEDYEDDFEFNTDSRSDVESSARSKE